MASATINLEMTIGPEAFERDQFVYVWLDGSFRPFYVGETAMSLADRAGLHIRDSTRSGALVSRLIRHRACVRHGDRSATDSLGV